MAPIATNNLFGDCPKCGTVSDKVTTIVDYPGDPEPAVLLACRNCKALFNVAPEGPGYSDFLKRIQPRTTRERAGPSPSKDEVERTNSGISQYSPRRLPGEFLLPPSKEEALALREKLFDEAQENGSLKCIICGRVPPGDFRCHLAVKLVGESSYLFTCDSALCQNKLTAELSRPDRGNIGIGMQSGDVLYNLSSTGSTERELDFSTADFDNKPPNDEES